MICVQLVIWVFDCRMQWQWLEPKEKGIQLFEREREREREREKSKGSKKFEREKTCLKKKIYLFLWQITNTTKAVFELTSN